MDLFEKLNQLPIRAQVFFQSDEIRLIVERVGLAFELPREKIEVIADLVAQIFFDNISLKNINVETKNRLGLSDDVARGVSAELVELIFSPFPEVFKDVNLIHGELLLGAKKPNLTPVEVEKKLIGIEPWLGRPVAEIVLKDRVIKNPNYKEDDFSLLSEKEQQPVVTEKLPLLKAMSQYRHLSDQILTASKIKVPGVMEPVRPSLSNWLKSYRSVLGVGVHGSAERGKFLFQSENGRKLSNEDRARLNLVLKSIEEGFSLEIDPKREMILFPSGEDVSMSVAKLGKKPATAFIRPSSFSDEQTFSRPAFLNQMPAGETKKPTLFSMTGAPEKNVAGKTLHFSTGHVFPAEKEETNISVGTPSSVPQGNMLSVAPVSSMNSSPVISRTPQQSIDRNPYMIRPLRMRPSEPTSPAKQ